MRSIYIIALYIIIIIVIILRRRHRHCYVASPRRRNVYHISMTMTGPNGSQRIFFEKLLRSNSI